MAQLPISLRKLGHEKKTSDKTILLLYRSTYSKGPPSIRVLDLPHVPTSSPLYCIVLKTSFLIDTALSLPYFPCQLWFHLFNPLYNKTPWETHTYLRPTNPFPPFSLYPHPEIFSITSNRNCSGQGQWCPHCRSSINARFLPEVLCQQHSHSQTTVPPISSRWIPQYSCWVTFLHLHSCPSDFIRSHA